MKTPHELAESNLQLADAYGRASEELEHLLATRAALWQKLREDCKSDKAADRAYEALPQGIREMALRMRMKRWEKEMSANKTMLQVLEGEARNQF